MSLKKIVMPLIAAAIFMAGPAQAQNLIVGADFTTRFDNREYSNNSFGESQTLFSARLTPRFGVEWMEKNRLVVGVDLLQNFGQNDKFLSSVKPQVYYQFTMPQVEAVAGIFDRKHLRGDYSPAFFSDSVAFYHNRISGFMGQYRSTGRPNTYVELAMDWEGMYSDTSREMFRIITAGRYSLENGFYGGYAFSLFHFAGQKGNQNVSDNMLANPYAGWQFKAFFDFDVRAGMLLAPQRARSLDNRWYKPCGAQIDLKISRWGVNIENSLYLGANLQPFYNYVDNPQTGTTYGQDGLYAGERFYSTDQGIYNRTWVGYSRKFFKDTLAIEAGMAFHYDGTGIGTQQIIQLSVDIEKLFNIGSKNKN